MDISAVAMAQNMQMLHSALSTMVLDKAMGLDPQSIAAILEMQPAAPQLAPRLGSMDISV